MHWLAFISLRQSEWANAYYRSQRARGHGHHRALRAKWIKIFFVMWRDHVPYDEEYHLANMHDTTCVRQHEGAGRDLTGVIESLTRFPL